jgi:hypothetical protein
MIWSRKDRFVEQLCRQSGGWRLAHEDGDRYWIANSKNQARQAIAVQTNENLYFVKFSADFPSRFSYECPPLNLFGMLLRRSVELRFAAWVMDVGHNCDAQPYLFCQQPRSAVDEWLFTSVCQEMLAETAALRSELQRVGVEIGSGSTGGHAVNVSCIPDGPSVPVARPNALAQPVRNRLPGP